MEDAEIDLRRVVGLVRRRIKLIGTVSLAVVCLGYAFLFFVTPTYTASSLIILDPRQEDLLDDQSRTASAVDNARIESEAELLRSDTILLKVIAAQELLDEPAFTQSTGLRTRLASAVGFPERTQTSAEDRAAQVLAKLRKAVSVQRRGPTYLLAVQVQSADPSLAASLANAIAQAYIDDQIASKVAALLSARDVLEARLIQAREEIVLSEAAFNDFVQRSTAALASQPGGSAIQGLNKELADLDRARLQTSHSVENISASLADKNWGRFLAAISPQQASMLAEQRQLLAQQMSAAGQGSPQQTSLGAQLATWEEQLAEIGADQLKDLRTELAAMDAQQAVLRENLRTEVMQSNLPADLLTGLYDLQGKANFAREQYQTLLARSLQLQSQSALQLADSRIASPALPPSAPSFPSTGLVLGASSALGLVLGLVASVVYEAVIGGFMSAEQLEASLKIQVGSSIPRLALEPGNDTLADLVITAPLSQFSEAMRRMRLVVDHAAGTEPGRVVMVTSAVPGEGKTTAAIGLARSYALSGQKTLLIDCDLRQPKIASETGNQPRAQLLDLLEQRSTPIDLMSSITREPDSGVSLLAGIRGTDQPTDRLLASARFNQIISQAVQLFDIVLIDTPAVEPVVDALYMAPRADLIVLVTRWARTSQRDVKQTLAALLRAKKPVAPIIAVLSGGAPAQDARNKKYRRFYDADFAWAPSHFPSTEASRPSQFHQGLQRGELVAGSGGLGQRHSSKNSLRQALDEFDA